MKRARKTCKRTTRSRVPGPVSTATTAATSARLPPTTPSTRGRPGRKPAPTKTADQRDDDLIVFVAALTAPAVRRFPGTTLRLSDKWFASGEDTVAWSDVAAFQPGAGAVQAAHGRVPAA